MDFMTKKESYAERRQLFKTIWETAMNIDEKEDIMTKPKVIKTLRLDEVDKCVVGKKKKQRIKNLRHVCKRILDFCDRQDADDIFYEQVATEELEHDSFQDKMEEKPHKKYKTRKCKKKVKKAQSMLAPTNDHVQVKITTSERTDEQIRKSMTKSRNTSPIRVKKTSFVRSTSKIVRAKGNPQKVGTVVSSSNGNTKHATPSVRRKVVKKKIIKKKKSLDVNISPPKSTIEWPEPQPRT